MKFERNVESIAFAYETDAIDTLVHLKDIIKAYGRVTVKDLMDLVGVAPNPDDDRLGWLNVDDTTINLIEQDKEHIPFRERYCCINAPEQLFVPRTHIEINKQIVNRLKERNQLYAVYYTWRKRK